VVDLMHGSIGVDDGLVARDFRPEIRYEMGIVTVDMPDVDPTVSGLIERLWSTVASHGIETPVSRVD
jgi:hypothetical protein